MGDRRRNKKGGYGRLSSGSNSDTEELLEEIKERSAFWELVDVLMPFFWPHAGTDGAIINRVRSAATWLFVSLSKTCSIIAPLYIAIATNSLIQYNWHRAVVNVIIFCSLRFASSLFKGTENKWYILFC